MENLIEVRNANASDVAFIFNSWIQSFNDGNYESKRTRTSVEKPEKHLEIEELIRNPNTTVIVACNPSDQDQLYGFACGTTILDAPSGKTYLVLHYVYVKQSFRNKKVASTLIKSLPGYEEATPFFFSQITYTWEKIMPKFKCVFNRHFIRKLTR